MDAMWNYDENGQSLEEGTILRWQERKEYVRMVAQFEIAKQFDTKLSECLADEKVQNLAYAMRTYIKPCCEDGRPRKAVHL